MSPRVINTLLKCYGGRNDNPSFIGSEPLDVLAERKSFGPSGHNKEYLYNLVAVVRDLSPNLYDSHLYAFDISL
ncbi:putative glutathione-specific gamma-glutamylcyclotransferase 2 [Hypsizygus marmoreus]|uniref:Glutathione-specific gamma-glutamylcyclotransferase 2 n=1 Tax=Hypsizygus marmoreus TaxID=39966 RepID=A0A369JN01_HYPMA|nr:putative glutathione-specific gamma-glutamylcyclotransferase 2 [Hypsizygus marmoreus]